MTSNDIRFNSGGYCHWQVKDKVPSPAADDHASEQQVSTVDEFISYSPIQTEDLDESGDADVIPGTPPSDEMTVVPGTPDNDVSTASQCDPHPNQLFQCVRLISNNIFHLFFRR